jgi:hypothetical protein
MHPQLRKYLGIAAATLLIAGCGGTAAPGPAAQATPRPTAAPMATADFATDRPSAPTRPPAAASLPPAPTLPPTSVSIAPTAQATADSGAGQAPAFARSLQLQDPHLQGDDVKAAQRRLVELGYTQVGAVDGIYGPNTDAAVRTFQTLNDLEIDGILGPRTWERLFSTAATRGSLVAPIVESDTRWLLGGAYGKHWLDGQTTATLLGGSEQYHLYSLAGPAGEATGSKPASIGPPCEGTFEVDLAPRPPISGTIALAGDWNALPRSSVEENQATSTYRQAVADVLRKNGITNPDVRLTRVVRADLEGDGTEEVLITATRQIGNGVSGASVGVGDYSVLVLRTTIDGVEKNIPIVGEYYTEAHEFAAPNEYKLVGVLDLNGDGKMEIVIHSAYYEGAATIVYSVDDGQAREVLSAGCGV